jgi:polyisoprenyl-phosphate glycosyltransferase
MKVISFISPCYNEEKVIDEYWSRVSKVADLYPQYCFEFVVVNDGSQDKSPMILDEIARRDKRLKVVHLAANVGHQIALFAGIEAARGDINITIDIDLQDPPELLEQFLLKINEGYQVVHGQRTSRDGETVFKLMTAKAYYRILSITSSTSLVRDCADFRAFTKEVREVIIRYQEKHKYLRGIFAIIGFEQTVIQYERQSRYAGETKYSLGKMMSLASDGLINFSRFPIRLMFIVSTLMWLLGLGYLVKAMVSKLVFGTVVDGWTSIIFFQVFFSGILLFFMALLGAYVGRIYEQGQARPDYIIRYTRNIETPDENH